MKTIGLAVVGMAPRRTWTRAAGLLLVLTVATSPGCRESATDGTDLGGGQACEGSEQERLLNAATSATTIRKTPALPVVETGVIPNP